MEDIWLQHCRMQMQLLELELTIYENGAVSDFHLSKGMDQIMLKDEISRIVLAGFKFNCIEVFKYLTKYW